MAHGKTFGRRLLPFDCVVAIALVVIVLVPGARAQEEKISSPALASETNPAEIRMVSTEFKFAPAKVSVTAGRAVALVLDNSGAETEHGNSVPAFGFRLEAKAGSRKTFVFAKPGEYDLSCDLPGHREAGMKGTLIVSAFCPAAANSTCRLCGRRRFLRHLHGLVRRP
jgi:plastocyanin